MIPPPFRPDPPLPTSVRSALAAALLLSLTPATPVAAQVSVGLRLGAVGSSALVHDSIVTPLTVRPQVAPALALRVEAPLGIQYGIAAEIGVSRSDLTAQGGGPATTVTALTTWTPSVGVYTRLRPWLQATARLGAIVYDPQESTGTLFQDEAPVDATLGVGLAAGRALGRRLHGAIHVHYDAHRFTTRSLRSAGFSGESVVHRLAIALLFSRSFGHAPDRD